MKQSPQPAIGGLALTTVLAALSDPVRLDIVRTLAAQGERGSTDFDCGLAGSTLSHHIRQLREAGVLQHRKEGTRCFVSLRPDLDGRFPGLLAAVLAQVPGGEASAHQAVEDAP